MITVRQAELGEYVVPGTPVVTIADLDHLWVRAYVSETDLGRVRWGQAVTLRTDTYPGKSYSGTISFISSDAEFTPKTVQTNKERVALVYRIKVDVENPQPRTEAGDARRHHDRAGKVARRMPEAAAIIVRDLVRGFPGVKAVDHLSFEVNYGEIFGLVGPDGAGKTTTMRILAGVLLPDAGAAQVAGFDVARDAERVKLNDQLHVATLRALRRFDGGREHSLLRRGLRSEAGGVSGAQRTAAARGGHAAVSQAPGGQSFRRNEAEARADLRADPHAAGAAAG